MAAGVSVCATRRADQQHQISITGADITACMLLRRLGRQHLATVFRMAEATIASSSASAAVPVWMPSAWSSLGVLPDELRLDTTLKCGQSFRWKETRPMEWTNVLGDELITLKQTDDDVLFRYYGTAVTGGGEPVPEDVAGNEADAKTEAVRDLLSDYFQLGVSLKELYKEWSEADPNFRSKASLAFRGIRVMRQDPVENLITFICTSNNNIARITMMVNNLCAKYGMPLAVAGDLDPHEVFYRFPTLEALSHESLEDELRELGFGYRAKFISQAARKLCADHPLDPRAHLLSLRTATYEEAHAELLKLAGVGPKVADCIALMSLDKKDAIPVDTHVWQIGVRDYGLLGVNTKSMTDKSYKLIGDHFRKLFGSTAGWAHSVLFTADLKAFSDRTGESQAATPRKKRKKAAAESDV
ncbi:DNA glycosylase, partial [Hyaloraphidium curvatum]